MVKGIWFFLGLMNFSIKFIKGFSQIMKPLLNLLKKKLSFEWQRSNKGHLKTWKISFRPPLCWNFQTSPNCLKSTLMWMILLLGESSCKKDTRLPLKTKTLWGTTTMANSWKRNCMPYYVAWKCGKHYLGTHKTKVFMDIVSLRYFKT